MAAVAVALVCAAPVPGWAQESAQERGEEQTEGEATTPPQPPARPAPGAVRQNGAARDGGAMRDAGGPEGGEGGEMFVFSAFAEPVELSVLVDYVRDQLGIPIIATDAGLVGRQVVLTSPIEIPREDVLPFITQLLEANGYTITRGVAGVYTVRPLNQILPTPGDDAFSTTRIIPTPGLQPSSLQNMLQTVVGIQTLPTPGAAGPGFTVGTGQAQVAFMDELGVMVVTGTPRQTQVIAELVARINNELRDVQFIRLDLEHVAGSYARQRLLELSGATRQPGGAMTGQPGQPMPPGLPGMSDSLLPFRDRLTVDTQGNALFFRGRPTEIEYIRELLAIVDRPNMLESRFYAVGRAAQAVAEEGFRQGLGNIAVDATIEEQTTPVRTFGRNQQNIPISQPSQRTDSGGAGFVIYPTAGGFIYRGTPTQHAQVQQLVAQLSELTAAEQIVVEFYKLRHSDAVEVAELIRSLLENQVPGGESPLLGGGLGQRGNLPQQFQPNRFNQPDAGDALTAIAADANTFVIADEANNQVVVKASKQYQPVFARLIEQFDLRRPQVYLSVQVVAVTANDDFRLAFETQLLEGNLNLNTNFGLGDLGASDTSLGNFGERKTVDAGLAGITAALVRSDYVPLIINALAQDTDTRILSSPQLLVDDNEEASVISVEEQPFLQTTQTAGNPLVTSQGGTAEAGTRLTVTPQISEGGYLRLTYEVELSNFTGQPTAEGLSPPKQTNTVSAESVTVPSDSTIVVGGIVVNSDQDTIIKVPFLGDIPILGYLFRDTREAKRSTTLYVFITPTIMRDPNFLDLRLLSEGPKATVALEGDLPPPELVSADILVPTPPPSAFPGRVPDAVIPVTPLPPPRPIEGDGEPAPLIIPDEPPPPTADAPARRSVGFAAPRPLNVHPAAVNAGRE